MAHELPALPWPKDALAPHMSSETLDYHHDKHHRAYVTKLNAIVAGTPYEGLSLVETMKKANTEGNKAVFQNAAQHFNHSFFWDCLAPNAGGAPTGIVAESINKAYGNFEAFKLAFNTEATTHFGSGWTWFVRDESGILKVVGTHDADCPLTRGNTPLLACDVWEHAYYIDHRDQRPAYVEAFWKLVNWDFVAKNIAG